MKTIKYFIILSIFLINNPLSANNTSFNEWLLNFKIHALENNISELTFDMAMSDVIFLPRTFENALVVAFLSPE